VKVDRAAAERSWTGPTRGVMQGENCTVKVWLRQCPGHDVVHGYFSWADAQADLLEHAGPRG